MKKIFLGLTLLLSPLMAFASVQDAVVKVISQSDGQPTSYGSGWLVQREDGAYVVTSEHVLKPKGIHQVLVGNKTIPCELIASDWGRGLALLKPLRAVSSGTRLDANSSSEVLSIGQSVQVLGFPFSQNEESLQSPGEIVLLKSNRAFLPLTSGIELIKSHGEFGMSGGPVFTTNGSFVGILSHQVLKVTPGEPSSIQALQSGTIAQNLFLIPREAVLQFLSSATSGRIERLSSGEKTLQLRSGSFVFTEKSSAVKNTQVAAAKGDGWGTGGGQEAANSLQMEVSLVSPAGEGLSFNFSNKLRDRLLQRKNVVIVGFFSRDQVSKQIKQYRFQTAEEFVRLLVQPNLFPVLAGTASDEGANAKMMESIRSAQEFVAKFEAVGFKEDRLILEIKTILSLAQSENRLMLEKSDLTRLLDASGAARDSWRVLYGKDFDSSFGLMNQLTELANLL